VVALAGSKREPVEFEYMEFPLNTGRKVSRPVARLTFEHEGNRRPFYCLIDSGADESASFVEIGEALGIDFKDCPKSFVTGLGGEDILVYKRVIVVEAAGRRVPIDVSWQERKLDPNRDFPFVIGRLSFFDSFDVEFRQHEKKFYIRPA
jgi:hypothetical protein